MNCPQNDGNSFLETFFPQSRCESDLKANLNNHYQNYQVQQQDFETFNADRLQTKSKNSQNPSINQETVLNNLTQKSHNGLSKDRHASLFTNNITYDSETKGGDVNNTVPLIISNSNLSDSVEKQYIPSWTTGIQRIPAYEGNYEQMYNEKFMRFGLENSMSKMLSKISQLEQRMNNSDSKMALSKEIANLKYNEKKLESNIGRYENLKYFRARTIFRAEAKMRNFRKYNIKAK